MTMTTPDKIQSILDEFSDASKRFRELINLERRRYIIQNGKENCFNKICCGMDYVGDVLLGFQGYLERDDSCEVGQDYYLYVEIIGILNCMQVQQDVVSEMYNLITGKDINLKKEYEGIKEIRETRNAIAAHPMNSNGDAHFINRSSLSKWSFEHYFFDKNMTMQTKKIGLAPFLYHQAKALNHVLKRIIDYMETEDKKHTKQFKNEKLTSIFSQHDFFSSKLFEECYQTRCMHVKCIQDLLDKFESALLKRSKHFLDTEWFRNEMPLIKHALFKCSSFPNIDDDSRIYAFFVAEKLKELKNTAQEIDDDYSN